MSEFKIAVDLSDVINVKGIITAEMFPLLNQAVRAVAQQTRIDWIEAVQRAKLWSGEKAPYAASIQVQMTGDFSALVWTDFKLAEEIENGRPAKDLKDMLSRSLKVRVSKKGKRYLMIPFRHNVPEAKATGQAMPSDVYDLAKELAPSSVYGQTRRVSGVEAYHIKSRRRLTVKQNTYTWGDRLPEGLKPKLKAHHTTDIYAGMVRFDTSAGGPARSTYMTFRTMVEGSPKWLVPPRPGLNIAKGVSDRMQPLAERAFQEAIRRQV